MNQARTSGSHSGACFTSHRRTTCSSGSASACAIISPYSPHTRPCGAPWHQLTHPFRLPQLTHTSHASLTSTPPTAWYASATALGSYGGLNGALRIMANLLYFLASFIIVLSIYRIDFSSVWLPLSTVIISLSFAVGPLLQQTLTNLFFVLVTGEEGGWGWG